MNIFRILLAVLAIVALLVGTLSSIDPDTVQLAVLPLVLFFFAAVVLYRAALEDDDYAELTASPLLLAARAPPLS